MGDGIGELGRMIDDLNQAGVTVSWAAALNARGDIVPPAGVWVPAYLLLVLSAEENPRPLIAACLEVLAEVHARPHAR